MDIDAYLNRIGYHGPRDPTARTLRELHMAHMLTVPFENLSIHLGQPIIIDEDALFHKIVERRRGGFCYELNGLFAALLRALGFDVTLLSAGVARQSGGFGPEFDHMALLVLAPGDGGWGMGDGGQGTTTPLPPPAGGGTEGGRSQESDVGSRQPQNSKLKTQNSKLPTRGWLADVGFGDSFRQPLRLDEPGAQQQDGRAYQFAREGERWTLLAYENGTNWSPQYQFSLQPRRLDDYAAMCHYHQTSPASSFTQRRLCSLATPQGRITLSDMRLIFTADGVKQEQLLADQQEYAAALREHFGINLDV